MCPHSHFAGAPGTLPEFNQAALAQLEAMGFPLIRFQKALLATGNSDPEAAMEWLFAHMEDPGTIPPTAPSQARNTNGSDNLTIDIDDPIVIAEHERWRRSRAGCGESEHADRDGLFACSGAQGAARDGAWPLLSPQFNPPLTQPHSQSGAPRTPLNGCSRTQMTRARTNNPAAAGARTLRRKKSRCRSCRCATACAFVSHKGPSVHSSHYVAHIRTNAGWVLFNDEEVFRADPESVRGLKALAYPYVFERDPPAAA